MWFVKKLNDSIEEFNYVKIFCEDGGGGGVLLSSRLTQMQLSRGGDFALQGRQR